MEILEWIFGGGGLELYVRANYLVNSCAIRTRPPLPSRYVVACAICSHVSVAILVVVYERGEVAGRSRVESCCATRDLESNLRLYTR